MDPKGESDSKVEDGSSSKEVPSDSLQELEANNPAPASRTNLVELAVKFLTNPRVTDSPMDQKKAFLKNKGTYNRSVGHLAGFCVYSPQIYTNSWAKRFR